LLVWLGSFNSPARSEYAYSEIYGDMGKGSRAPSVGGSDGSSITAMSPFPRSFSGADASGSHTPSDDVFSPLFGKSGLSSSSIRIDEPIPSRSNTSDIDVDMVPQIECSVDADRTAPLSTELTKPTRLYSRSKEAEHFEGFRHILTSSDEYEPSESDEEETTPYLHPVKEGNTSDIVQPFSSPLDQYSSSDSSDTDFMDRPRPQQPFRHNKPRRPLSDRSRQKNTVSRTSRQLSDSESESNEDPPVVHRRKSRAPNIINRKLPKTPHGRPRRVLVPKDPEIPFVTISMREDVQFFHRKKKCGP
jgi:hypothetical protein